MKKILFATDFSVQSEKAFPIVLDLAEQLEAQLILLHVYTIPHTYKFPYTAQTFQKEQQEVKEAEEKLKEIFETHFNMGQRSGNIIYKVVRDNSAVRGILNVSEEEDIDLLTLAVRGDNRSEEKLFGSLIKNIVRQSIPPVIVIPENAKKIKFDRFLFTTNLSPSEILPINGIIELVKPHAPRITIFHINSTTEVAHELKLKDFKELLSKYIKYDNLYFHEALSSDIFKSLDARIRNFKYDVLVMTKQWHSSMFYRMFHEDLVEKMEFSSTIPVLSFNLSVMDNYFFKDDGYTDETETMNAEEKEEKQVAHIFEEISQLTLEIKSNYPELYRHLDENPITIPSERHPKINKNELNDYLSSLKQLIDHHREQNSGSTKVK